MRKKLSYAHRSWNDAGSQMTTMDKDPNTGNYPGIHSSGDALSVESKEGLDEYVSEGAVVTTHPDGSNRQIRDVHAITTKEPLDFKESCAASGMCVHKAEASVGKEPGTCGITGICLFRCPYSCSLRQSSSPNPGPGGTGRAPTWCGKVVPGVDQPFAAVVFRSSAPPSIPGIPAQQ